MSLMSLPRGVLVQLAEALRQGRIKPPFRTFSLHQTLEPATRVEIATELLRLSELGMTPEALAATLELLAKGQEERQRLQDRLELVWTGPEPAGSMTRDTGVVVQELFARAKSRLLISTFVIYQGRDLFKALATRMDAEPALAVQLFLHVGREKNDHRPPAQLATEFLHHFKCEIWPGKRLPDLYYDPRALEPGGQGRLNLHAKCIAADDHWLFVTSANFTEAAQQRNVELGILAENPSLARHLREQFEHLVAERQLKRLVGG